MNIVRVEEKKDGRQLKQVFKGKYITTSKTVGNTTDTTTTPVLTTSGSLVMIVRARQDNTIDAQYFTQPLSLLTDERLPQLGTNYIENGVTFNDLYYTEATPRFIGTRGNLFEWEITYQISGEFANTQSGGSSDEKVEETVLLSFSTSVELEDYAQAWDLDGEWNCNSLGEFFADPIILKNGILNLNYQRREYANPLWKSRDYFQAVNDVDWYEFPKGTIKVSDISFNATQYTDRTEYDVNYKLQYRPNGWKIEKANTGLYCNYGGIIQRILNADGSPIETPAILNIDGTLATSGPIFKSYKVCPEKNLNGLNLPNPFKL